MRFHRLRVLRRLPHPGRGFTQGLIVTGGTVWESTGRYGQSALRRYPLGATEAEACAALPPELFAEGICRAGGAIWQLTWQERTALRWHPDSLALLATIPYNREGWGICEAGEYLMTSDGSSELVRRDPQTLARGHAHLRPSAVSLTTTLSPGTLCPATTPGPSGVSTCSPSFGAFA